MQRRKNRDETVDRWLSESETDLNCSRILFDHQIFSRALYHLQQSNEKLSKALLISVGILTPKRQSGDFALKSQIGFSRKEPAAYSHRTLQSLVSDLNKAIPNIEDWLEVLDAAEFKKNIDEFHKTIRNSKKGVQKLKKKPFALVETAAQLENETKMAAAILDNINKVTDEARTEASKIDPQALVRAALKSAEKAGLDVSAPPALPSIPLIIDEVASGIRLAVLASLSASMASFLDPLESVTRYPDSAQNAFNVDQPYVVQFKNLYNIVERCLAEARPKKERKDSLSSA